MLIGGLWHGAAWKFVFWGAMHGVGLAVHKASKPILEKIPNNYPVKVLSWTVTIVYVSLLWVFFRAESWTDSWLIIKNIFTNFSVAHIAPFLEVRYVWCVMMAVIILSHAMPRRWYDKMGEIFVNSNWIIKILIFIVVVQFVVQFMSEDVAPFIYFQF